MVIESPPIREPGRKPGARCAPCCPLSPAQNLAFMRFCGRFSFRRFDDLAKPILLNFGRLFTKDPIILNPWSLQPAGGQLPSMFGCINLLEINKPLLNIYRD